MGGGPRGSQSRTQGAKKQKAVKKRESCRRKKEDAARLGEESLAEIEARWVAAYKAGKENPGVWPAYASMAACEK